MVFENVHPSTPHRCCRNHCRPTTAGGKPSCTCEVQADSHAIIGNVEVRSDSHDNFCWYIDTDGRFDSSAILRSRSLTKTSSLIRVQSPGRGFCITLQRWLI
ncbi:hypothetical protein RSSM_00860 [Rhodopirellula sallentina SM41]|uniref:Uncharacterized protein n=1 Tax=Rhodopirellula sallentina SM41 TaxID=1263870 RepID=M5U8R5_9BACT|nr:hypothetical protein RSSM_00860 [Rhodopirellula sallentina SM41]